MKAPIIISLIWMIVGIIVASFIKRIEDDDVKEHVEVMSGAIFLVNVINLLIFCALAL